MEYLFIYLFIYLLLLYGYYYYYFMEWIRDDGLIGSSLLCLVLSIVCVGLIL